MPFYALATIPLLGCLPSGVEQVWYADDACACGKLTVLRKWWDCLCEIGPSFGYFVRVRNAKNRYPPINYLTIVMC